MLALAALGMALVCVAACAPRAPRPAPASAPSSAGTPDSSALAGTASGDAPKGRGRLDRVVTPLPGWPRWLGDANHQISGLAFRDGHLYAVSDQRGVLTRALLEIGPLPPAAGLPGSADNASRLEGGATGSGEGGPPEPGDAGTRAPDAGTTSRSVGVQVRCRWQGGPHPDAEGMALDPFHGTPRTAVLSLETQADALVEIGFDDCALRAQVAPLTGSDSNEGIEGIALSPDGRTVYLVHETRRTLLTMPRGGPGPAREIATIREAHSLCDAAYDDRGTAATSDDRLLLLDRNARRIFDVTLDGRIVGRWDLDRDALARDPDGHSYALVALEGLAIEAREPDGSLLVYAATDTPPRPLPYSRRGRDDEAGLYARRVGMLYRFRLPPLE